MSVSAAYKKYQRKGGDMDFAAWKALYDRLASARKARGSSHPRTKLEAAVSGKVLSGDAKPITEKRAEYVRVEHRVDCFGVTRHGVTLIGADASDAKRVAKLCGGRVVSTYTSKRGERARIECMGAVNVRKLTAAGFTPKGF